MDYCAIGGKSEDVAAVMRARPSIIVGILEPKNKYTQQRILHSPHGKLEFLGVNLNIFFTKK
jgi:hypothetical protein